MEKKKEYINDLLSTIQRLEDKVVTSRNDDALPFSFFRDAFDKTEKIMRLLHELENMQIDEMKGQMEKLVGFLSETKNQQQPVTESMSTEVPSGLADENAADGKDDPDAEIAEDKPDAEEISPMRNRYAQGVVFPEYKKPEVKEVETEKIHQPAAVHEAEKHAETVTVTSFNDLIQKEPAVLDLKRGISLNDRFVFQRELFGNDRYAMNNMMLKLNAFDRFEDAEKYLHDNTSWNFDDQAVQDFLFVIKKGFE